MNPFILSAYKSPEFFCDREKESKEIIQLLTNGINIVIYSLRRIGKTGLIHHVFNALSKEKEQKLIYIDIYRTENPDDFVNELATAILRINEKKWYEKALDFIKGLRPILTFNPVTGQPEAEIKAANPTESLGNIDAIFDFLEQLSNPVIIAIDEFQQITEYPEKGFEGYLRSKIQFLNNVHFIFSGSNRRLIQSMFMDYNRPFYQSASTLYIDKIEAEAYFQFVKKLMAENDRIIEDDLVRAGLKWTEYYTWFAQNYFNRLWGKGSHVIDRKLIEDVKAEIFSEKSRNYIELKKLLPENQMKLYSAIAKENIVQKPNAKEFLLKYKLGSASSINSALSVLINKELIYQEDNGYQLYDIYMKRFIQTV